MSLPTPLIFYSGTASTDQPGTDTVTTKHGQLHPDPMLGVHHCGISPSPNVQRRAVSPNIHRKPQASPNVQVRHHGHKVNRPSSTADEGKGSVASHSSHTVSVHQEQTSKEAEAVLKL